MMSRSNLAKLAIEKPLYTWMLVLACLFGGLYGIDNVGRLEDPPFPIKMAYIITVYPGASAEEVELEVTDRIEAALQELPYIDHITSKSVSGRSEIQIELQEQYGAGETPQIFDELRRRVSEAEFFLPPGVSRPIVEDDFGDVYGILYAVSSPGYDAAEVQDIARLLSTRLKQIEHVAKVDTSGVPQEAVYLEIDHSRLSRLGLSITDLAQRIAAENKVMPAGSIMFDGRRLRIAQSQGLQDIAALDQLKLGRPGSTDIILLGDIATIRRTGVEVPSEIVRHDGKRVFTLSVSVTKKQNVVAVGKNVDREVARLMNELPLGVEITPIYQQHQVVEDSITLFLKNLALSVATVIIALCLFMGWRAGTVVGVVLLLTVLGTVALMYVASIELHRISLGALMIAMGMLVDNGIVIAEGMVIGVRRGMLPADAAAQSVERTQFPLLGATVIGILAFAPISLSNDNSGHFLISLFQVVAISLLLSWLLAITMVPLFGSYLFKVTEAVPEDQLYGAWYFTLYKKIMSFGLRRAWFTTIIIVIITSTCLWSMGFVKTSFFPTTNTPLIYVDYRLPEGTDILTTAASIEPLEQSIRELPGVVSSSTFIGRGAPRFSATARPEQPNPAYAQMILRVSDINQLNSLMVTIDQLLKAARPDADIQVTRTEFSPGGSSKIEARYSGPDADVLRSLAEKALGVYTQYNLIDRKTNWRLQSLQLAPNFDEANAQLTGISRQDLARSLAYNTLGVTIGLLRDGDKLVPIVARAPKSERSDLSGLGNKQVWSPIQRKYVPISQVVSAFELEAENTTLFRRDRVRTIIAQANPPKGYNTNQVFTRIRPAVEALELPPGYTMEWGGEFESNKQANQALGQRLPSAFAIMFLITILMFGALKQPIVIWLTVPMVICGVAIGLLITDLPLTFPSFLGVLSLTGMLIKNCIVLIDEIDKRLNEGEQTVETMLLASLSRLRPVMLAALTTVFGMAPLLTDAFFREMAVCIMSGLMFATLLTLVAVPVFYRIALGQRITDRGSDAGSSAELPVTAPG